MLEKVPAHIKVIIRALLVRRMEVACQTKSDGRVLYFVNGRPLSEDELRALSQKRLLTSSDIGNYTRSIV